MQQLTGQDASFLYAETPNAPMHVGSVGIYDQSGVTGGSLRFKQILDYNAERLHLAPITRRRLVRVPGDVDHPYWVEDKDFDLEYHIRHIALPEPGDWRQLYILASRILAQPLDLTRPAWETYYVEGLSNCEGIPPNCFAVISKTHHCAIDGASGVTLFALLHDITPVPQRITPPDKPWRGEAIPSDSELLARAATNNFTQPLRMMEAVLRAIPANQRFAAAARETRTQPMPAPRTRFNRPVSPHRVIGFRRFALDDIKAIRKTVPGATVNDVAVAIVGGALRNYLSAKQELPADALVAMAPINVRDPSDKSVGNQVAAMLISTASNVADPRERLGTVQRSSEQSKTLANAIGAKQMTDAMKFVPGSLMVIGNRFASEFGLLQYQQSPYNVTITNVPGPQMKLYSMGAELVTMFGFGPLTESVGLIFPVSSYCGEFAVSFTCCREMMPDPEHMEVAIAESFAELRALAP